MTLAQRVKLYLCSLAVVAAIGGTVGDTTAQVICWVLAITTVLTSAGVEDSV